MSLVSKLRPIFTNPKGTHTSTVIFLHGSGDTGQGIKEWLHMILDKEFEFENTKVVYPTAPLRPYTPMNENLSSVWFNRRQISPFVPEELDTIDPMCRDVQELIDKEIAFGIPMNRIIIGGFSMGGALSYHMAYRFCNGLAGIFALSSFLNDGSAVYEAIKSRKDKEKLPPLFQCHGLLDPLVDFSWGKKTTENIEKLGIDVIFHQYENMFHEMNKNEITKLEEWITKKLCPPKL